MAHTHWKPWKRVAWASETAVEVQTEETSHYAALTPWVVEEAGLLHHEELRKDSEAEVAASRRSAERMVMGPVPLLELTSVVVVSQPWAHHSSHPRLWLSTAEG